MQRNLSNGLIAITREDLEKIKKSAFDEGFEAGKAKAKPYVEAPKAKEKVGKNDLRKNIVEEEK